MCFPVSTFGEHRLLAFAGVEGEQHVEKENLAELNDTVRREGRELLQMQGPTISARLDLQGKMAERTSFDREMNSMIDAFNDLTAALGREKKPEARGTLYREQLKVLGKARTLMVQADRSVERPKIQKIVTVEYIDRSKLPHDVFEKIQGYGRIWEQNGTVKIPDVILADAHGRPYEGKALEKATDDYLFQEKVKLAKKLLGYPEEKPGNSRE